MTISKTAFRREIVPDPHPNTSFLEQEGFENRLEEFQRGGFNFVAVRAAVDLRIPHGMGYIRHRIESPGLWGIESDSGEDYLDSVFQEESATLADMLAELGVKVA
jgi:hypothetical protein